MSHSPTVLFNIPTDDIDVRCVPFIGVYGPFDEAIKYYDDCYQKTVEDLVNLFENYSHESEKPFQAALKIEKRCSSHFKPIRNFCVKKYNNYYKKLNSEKAKFYSEKAQIAANLSVFLHESKNLGTPSFVDIEEFKNCVQKDYKNNEKIKIYLKKMTILVNYINRYAPSGEYSKQLDVVRATLFEAESVVDSTQEYAPYNLFDIAFEEFTGDSKSVQRFEQGAKLITKNTGKKVINLREIDHIFKSFNMLIQPANKDQQLILHFAIVRSIFDQISLIPNFFLFADVNTDVFMKSCDIMKNMTPSEHKISPRMVGESNMEKPFFQIIECSPELREATSILNSLHFINNPFDLVQYTFVAMKHLDTFVLSNSTRKSPTESSDMSFDDVFSLFCPLIAYNPPSNAVAVSKFLMSIEGLQFSPALDFAKLILSSTIDYIERFDPKIIL